MFGIGAPELLVLLPLVLWLYGLVMTIDAIRRPSAQYQLGNKAAWVTALVLLNPLLLRFLGATIWLIGSFMYVVLAITYHLAVRRGSSTPPAT